MTAAPPSPPPQLRCPKCNRTLSYEVSYVGGVNDRHPEQWDYFTCTCGSFRYRHRTRKVTALARDESLWLKRRPRGA